MLITDGVPIEPIWKTKYSNQKLALYTGKSRFTTETYSCEFGIVMEFDWSPSPRVAIWANGPHDLIHHWDTKGATIELLDQWAGFQIEVYGIRCIARQDGVQIDFSVLRWPDALLSIPATAAVFHVANLRTFHGSFLNTESRLWRGRARLTCHDWNIVIDEICPADVPDSLGSSAGFALTHVGHIERNDRSPFTGNEVSDVMGVLGRFLSFCNGRRCGPILCHGFAETPFPGDWIDWRVQRTWPIQPVRSWWNENIGVAPFASFARFYELSNDEIWTDTLRIAVHWYLEANRPGALTEVGIVLTQLAFEGLADTLIVEDKGLLSSEGLKKLEAHDKLRLLLRTCGIDSTVPSSLRELSSLSKRLNWDAADAITEVRNAHVHPTKKNRDNLNKKGVTTEIKHEVSMLSSHFLELILLFLMDYSGDFASRIAYGSPEERVPWGK